MCVWPGRCRWCGVRRLCLGCGDVACSRVWEGGVLLCMCGESGFFVEMAGPGICILW